MKKLSSLIKDIYTVLQDGKGSPRSDQDLQEFAEEAGKNIAGHLVNAIKEDRSNRKPYLRISNIGKHLRQLWYDLKDSPRVDEMKPHDQIRFLYGHILEDIVLFLCYASGHEVTEQQKEVIVEGVVGHKDCRIDGVTIDVKSASPYGFKKFKEKTLYDDDPFGYISQLSGYLKGEGDTNGGFLAIDKSSGELALLEVHPMELHDVKTKIETIKSYLKEDKKPPRCYDDVPYGKSGNRQLCTACRFCAFKYSCWEDCNAGVGIRKFNYSNGIAYLTEVQLEPKVEELK
jgi:hypothetical protein